MSFCQNINLVCTSTCYPVNLITFITGAHPYLSSAHPEAHHSVRQPPENQEGAGEITGYLCPRGRRHDEYKRLLPCPRERLQLLMRVRKTQWNLFSRWPTPPLLPKKERTKYSTWLLLFSGIKLT